MSKPSRIELTCDSICLAICSYVYVYIHVYVSVCLSVWLSSVWLSVCLSVQWESRYKLLCTCNKAVFGFSVQGLGLQLSESEFEKVRHLA